MSDSRTGGAAGACGGAGDEAVVLSRLRDVIFELEEARSALRAAREARVESFKAEKRFLDAFLEIERRVKGLLLKTEAGRVVCGGALYRIEGGPSNDPMRAARLDVAPVVDLDDQRGRG